jgi:hypothetical protein
MFPQSDHTKWTPENNPEGLRSWWRAEGQAQDGGPVADEPIDVDENGHPDQFEALVWQLEKLYTEFGVRRFILWIPAGSYFGYQKFLNNNVNLPYFIGQDLPANQWYGMPAWKRAQFSSSTGKFQQWRAAHPSVKFDLYMGAPLMDDACTLHCRGGGKTYPGTLVNEPTLPSSPRVRYVWTEHPTLANTRVQANRWVVRNDFVNDSRAIDPRDESHIDRIYTIFNPWIQSGIRTFWLDAAAVRECSDPTNPVYDFSRPRWGVHELAYAPFLINRGVRIGGEAFPTVDDNGQNVNPCDIRQIPYLGLDSWLYSRNNPDGTVDLTWRYTGSFDRYLPPPDNSFADTEPHWFAAGDISTFERLGEARVRGYVVSPFYNMYRWHNGILDDVSMVRRVQRWYSMGEIQIADFNGDGVVGINPHPQTGLGAGTIERDDWYAFHQYWNAYQDNVTNGGSTRPFTVFAMGDICGATYGSPPDGHIDDIDRVYWEMVFNTTQSLKLNYGEADGL